uniref:Amino acid transporter n=1 Tax=Hymenolepis diminuta TaxID=6216 RepID=A0A0R3SYT6_HYMDI
LKKNGIISIVGITSIILVNLIGTLIGTACAAIIQPGPRKLIEGGDSNSQLEGSGLSASDVVRDIFMNLFPDNIIGVALLQRTLLIANYLSNYSLSFSLCLGILFISVVFGAAANAVGKMAKPLIKFFEAVSAVVTKLMAIFLRYRCNKLASRFVLLMCLALKGDGPAIFFSVACMFIAQQSGVEINASKIIFIILLTFALTCAIPHVPSASMVLVVTVLSSTGLPSASASILFTMEWFLDRCRSGTAAVSAMYISVMTSEICERKRLKQEELVEELSGNEGTDTSVFSNEV